MEQVTQMCIRDRAYFELANEFLEYEEEDELIG